MAHQKKVLILTTAALVACAIPAKLAIAPSQPALAQSITAQSIAQAASFSVPESVPQGTRVRISSGSRKVNTLSEALQQGFEDSYPGSEIEIETKTAEQAIQDVLSDNADLAAISRPLTTEEEAKGLQAIALRREKIAIVVDQSNPFSQSLTGNQFAQIFRGEITDWAAVGGTSRPITLVDRPASSKIRQSLRPYPIFDPAPFETGANATTLQTDTAEALASTLGSDGIGYLLVSELASQPSLKALPLHQTLPTDDRYPFSQPYSLVYAEGATSLAVDAFLGYATGQPGQDIVANTNLTEEDRPVAASPTTTIVGTPNADGQLVDAEGNLISPEGFLINSEGELIDANGNLLAEEAEGVLGVGIDPSAGDRNVGDPTVDIDEELSNISDRLAEEGRWWWLLLPLSGLGLLIWAASKSSDEETDYKVSAGSSSAQGDRIISDFDSEGVDSDTSSDTDPNLTSSTDIVNPEVSNAGMTSTGAVATPPITENYSDETANIAADVNGDSAKVATNATAIEGIETVGSGDMQETPTTAEPISPMDIPANASFEGSPEIPRQSLLEESPKEGFDGLRGDAHESEPVTTEPATKAVDNGDWLQRAKQRINEATEQMKQTAVEIQDDTTRDN
ncbi:substrate-binding domain-containing protein [cf. Phormidesmis sp. LEGE 11477]|uniref:substrate-binding domain-containing protein n=1 Tax=cf. Phormidesmis sp. LEGE 11477 TaxID=1828680 RepID=UPI001D144BC6|nr:substrate-binding domain-containing protein [cf. Phormidesmis sp. LEGE 11477]